MSSTHPVNRTTEWEDLQVKYGNLPERPHEVTEQEQEAVAVEATIAALEGQAHDSSRDLGHERDGDGERDSDSEELVLERLRRQRLKDILAKKQSEIFGTLIRVTSDNFVNEVTEASRQNRWVLCHLYSDRNTQCVKLNELFDTLAKKHRGVKFCLGEIHSVVPNFRNGSLPCVTVYHDGRCVDQLVGPSIFGGAKMSLAEVEGDLARRYAKAGLRLHGHELAETEETLRGKKSVFHVDLSDNQEQDLGSSKGYASMTLDNLTETVFKS